MSSYESDSAAVQVFTCQSYIIPRAKYIILMGSFKMLLIQYKSFPIYRWYPKSTNNPLYIL